MVNNRSSRHVAIIGAGPSGLSVLKELKEEGHTGVIFEKGFEVGGNFRTSYQQGFMTSSTSITLFSDFLGSKGEEMLIEPRMLTFREYADYLNEYIEHFDLKQHICFNCEVELIERIPSENEKKDVKYRWCLTITNTNKNTTEKHLFDSVVVCSGGHHYRALPTFKGQNIFKGTIRHQQSVKRFEEFAGKRVCVIGGGEAASDMILAAAKHGAKAYHSIRGDYGHLSGRYQTGCNIPSDLQRTRLSSMMPVAFYKLLVIVSTCLQWVGGYIDIKGFFLNLLTSQLRLILAGKGSTPDEKRSIQVNWKIFKLNQRRNGISHFRQTYGTKSEGMAEALLFYGSVLKPGISELRDKSIVFDDGSEEEIDEILCCTGFEHRFPFLDNNVKDEIIQQVGRDARISHNLYKHAIHPLTGIDLVFIGFVRPCFGAPASLADLQSRWFALLCSGSRKIPSNPICFQQYTSIYRRYLAYQFNQTTHLDRMNDLTDLLLFSDDLARLIDCRPDLSWRTLLFDTRLWLRCMIGPLTNIQYRLRGPHAQAKRARQLLLMMKWSPNWISSIFELLVLLLSVILYSLGLRQFEPPTWNSIEKRQHCEK